MANKDEGISTSDFYLRPVGLEDAEMLLEWVNDPLDRANSFSSARITLDEHMLWLEESLSNPLKHLYVMVYRGKDVGHIKLSEQDGIADIGYCIAPEWRGRGFAKVIVGLVVEEAAANIPSISVLVGEVKSSNVPSQKAFLSAGFEESCYVYRKQLPSRGK